MFDSCSVPNCNSLRKDVKLHVFPCVNVIRLTKWLDSINSETLRALNVDELRKRFVCHKHFEKRFITSKSRLLGTAYPTLFTGDEILSGIPSVPQHDTENTSTDHNYARKRHYDHSYAKTGRPLGICQQLANLPGPSSLVPSTSKTFVSTDTRQSIVDVPATDMTDSSTEKTIVPVHSGPRRPMINDSLQKSVTKRKRIRIVRKANELSPKCKRIYAEYKKSRKQLDFMSRAKRALIFSKSQSFENLTQNMGEYAKKLFWMQIKMSMKDKKGRRFTLDEKIIALSILKQSPKCYKFLKKIFILPSRTTLKKLVAQLKIEPGVNQCIFDLIKQKVQSWNKEEKKYCSIIFDEMAIDTGLSYAAHKDEIAGVVHLNERKPEYADHALVFMAKGALYKWQQPLGFYFCKGATSATELKAILKQIVKAVGETGLIPVALISDQGPAFQSALKSLQQDTRREQILDEQNTDNVISLEGYNMSVIYDPPHLIKGLRNNFLTKDILFDNKVAKWSDIVDVYKADCRHAETRLLHKLNDEHVIPEKIKKMKVSNCVRVFSKTMAGALAYTSQFSHYTDGTPVSESLATTSNLVRFLDDLFDSVNGASLQPKKGRGKDLPRAVTEKSKHHEFWREAIKKLKNIKFIDKNNKQVTVPSLKNWIVTLESFMRLWQFFKSKNIKIMRPRYLNSDSIENFFGQVRAYNFRSNDPNCQSFMNTFKSLLITGFIKFHNESYNCEEDNFNQLLKMTMLFKNKPSDSEAADVSCHTHEDIASLRVSDVDSAVVQARQERLNIHSRAYTAGWVIRKILNKVKCNECKKKLTADKTLAIHNWIAHKEYKLLTQRNLIYPSEWAVRSFGVILKHTNDYLEMNPHKYNISKHIKENIKANEEISNIACESHQNLTEELFVEITIKLAIFNWCNIINKILRGTDIFRLQKRSLPTMQNKAYVKYTKKLKRK